MMMKGLESIASRLSRVTPPIFGPDHHQSTTLSILMRILIPSVGDSISPLIDMATPNCRLVTKIDSTRKSHAAKAHGRTLHIILTLAS